ncbi:MAG: hypothetical protein HY770_01220, partial [Chitinivibrionia bacterium]|nr:hypothetical protein [Chitinivibrionia bacterium]
MKLCPFISHLQREERSEVLTIESAEKNKKAQRSAGGAAAFRGDETGAAGSVAATAVISAAGSSESALRACLRDPCRFYLPDERTCAFESMLAAMKTVAARQPDASRPVDPASPRILKEIDKLWKFETKSVT